MALREQFVETVVAPFGVAGDLIPLRDIAVTVNLVNPDGTQGAMATAYANRTGGTLASPMVTDAAGQIVFWLDPGEYNINFTDLQVPQRVPPFLRGFSSSPYQQGTAVSANQLVLPIGLLAHYTGTADPIDLDGVKRWLICDGRTVSRATYPAYNTMLHDLGYPFGAGDTTTTFNIPDLRGRVVVGIDSGSLRLPVNHPGLAGVGGEEQHVITTPEMALHNHTLTDPQHHHGYHDPGHNHGWDSGLPFVVTSNQWGWNNSAPAPPFSPTNYPMPVVIPGYTGSSNSQLQPSLSNLDISDATTGITIASVGANNAHNNLQPYMAVSHIVKVL